MFQRLGEARLKTGETAELGVVRAPDPGDPLAIRPLLGHKGEPWSWHIDRALDDDLGGLETRFYVALLGDRAVSNVMTVEHRGTGILGHVFTPPEHRRKGLCDAVFGCLLPEFRGRGGLRLTLGTGYDSAPYWIYHRHGFRPVVEGTWFMQLTAADDFAARWYAPGETRVAPYTWRHWPTVAQLAADDFGRGLQALGLGLFGRTNTEGPGLGWLKSIDEHHTPAIHVLESEHGAVVGLAAAQPDRRWAGAVWLLDVVVHPQFVERVPELVDSLPLPPGKVQCCLPATDAARRAALAAVGFDEEATLRGQLADGGDVVVLARR